MATHKIKIVECPRDAMQGWKTLIPTQQKIDYLNQLLRVGFDVLDCGSFVSPKAIPQMADTAEVLNKLDLSNTKSKLLTIIANTRGAEQAVGFDQVHYLGFPFSISETFQLKNTNKTIEASLKEVEEISNLCVNANKELVVYISMGFGNPYGDPYSPEIAMNWVGQLSKIGIKTFAMSDTVGIADPKTISSIFSHLIQEFPNLEIGAHFHSTPQTRLEKLDAAWNNGCRRFDSSINGYGGCPMANDDLVGNMDTDTMVQWYLNKNLPLDIDRNEFAKAIMMSSSIFI